MSIIGAPINTGQPKTGVEKGPSSIREIGLIEKVREVGWRVIDEGDIGKIENNDFFLQKKKMTDHFSKNQDFHFYHQTN